MSIHQTPGGRWRVRYYESGQPNPRSKTFDTKTQARDFEASLRMAKRSGTTVRKASTQTLESFGAEYLEKYAKVELAPSTLKVQAILWNRHVLPRLGRQPLSTLAHNPELLQEFKAGLTADGVGAGAVRKTLAILSAVLAKAVEWNRIPSNPAATIRKPPAKRARVVKPMAPEQVERLRTLTMGLGYGAGGAELEPGRDSILVTLMAYAGLRPGEALALTWDDFGVRSISVSKAVALGEVKDTKTGTVRSVPLLGPLADDLGDYHEIHSYRGGLIIHNRQGGVWRDHDWRNWRKRVWREVAGADVRPYDLRHSFASLMLAEGTNPLEVAEMMGHSTQILFSTYGHVIANLRGAAAAPAEARIVSARERARGERYQRAAELEQEQDATEHRRKQRIPEQVW
jgi:integrase